MEITEGKMDLIATGIVAGLLGTLVMDSLNHLFARTRMLLKIDVRMIGRMSAGLARGRFRYRQPSEMEQVWTFNALAISRYFKDFVHNALLSISNTYSPHAFLISSSVLKM